MNAFNRFEQFVQATPPDALGTDIRTLEKLCHEDKEALDALDKAVRRLHGGDRRSTGFNIKDNNVILDLPSPAGNSSRQALRRLAQDRPDLHEKVIAGALTPHHAMVEAGFRPRTISFYPDDPERTARVLLWYLDAVEVQALVTLLRPEPPAPS